MTAFDDYELEKELAAVSKGRFTTVVRRKLESKFRANLVRQMKPLGGVAQPIESSTASGIPDIYMAKGKMVFWMELKFHDYLLGSSMKLRFRPNQRKWLLDNLLAGGMSVVGARFLDGYAFVRADLVALSGGGIPFGDDRFRGYVLCQKALDLKGMLIWLEYASTLPLLTDKVAVKAMKKKSVFNREASLEDEADPDAGDD